MSFLSLRELTKAYGDVSALSGLSMAERVAVIVEDRIVACDTPRMFYRDPDNTTVATLVGAPPMNLVLGRIEATEGTRISLQLALGRIPLELPLREGTMGLDVGREVFLGVRPITSPSTRVNSIRSAPATSFTWAATDYWRPSMAHRPPGFLAL